MGKIASKIIGIVFVCIILFFGLKSCIVTSWESRNNPATYSIRATDGRSLTIIFLPDFETIFWYVDPNKKSTEGVLAKMRGTYGTNYWGQLWKVDGPHAGGLLGYRWLPVDQKPIHMEIIQLDKYTEGRGEPYFGKTGKNFYTVILKEKDRIQFEGMWLELSRSDPIMIAELRAKFKPRTKL